MYAVLFAVTANLAVEEHQAVKRRALEDAAEHQRELYRVLHRADAALEQAFGTDTERYNAAKRCVFGPKYLLVDADVRLRSRVGVYMEIVHTDWRGFVPEVSPPTYCGDALVVKTVTGSDTVIADVLFRDDTGRSMVLHMGSHMLFQATWYYSKEISMQQ